MMDTEELRAAMRGATTELEPRPSLTSDVLRGGVRRQRQRRITIVTAVAAAAVAVAGTGVVGWQSISDPAPTATDPDVERPIQGDLAKDTAFVNEVARIWQQQVAAQFQWNTELPGRFNTRPHVMWAGNTGSGRAAMVVQGLGLRPGEQRLESVTGLVGLRDDKLAVLGASYAEAGRAGELGYRLGRTIVVLDQGKPLFVSEKVSYEDSGKAVRTWRPMTVANGVATAELAQDVGPMDTRVTYVPAERPNADDMVNIYPTDGRAALAEKQPKGLRWEGERGRSHLMWAGTEPANWQDLDTIDSRFLGILRMSPMVDQAGGGTERSPWYLSIGLPNGQTVIVGENQPLHSGPSRLFVVHEAGPGSGGVSAAGTIDPSKPLPVLAKMPDNQGWAAAAKGATLSFRTAPDAAWQAERPEALLVPVDAKQIKVQHPGQEPTIVDVPAS